MPGAAAVRGVVDGPVPVVGPLPQVVHLESDQAGTRSPARPATTAAAPDSPGRSRRRRYAPEQSALIRSARTGTPGVQLTRPTRLMPTTVEVGHPAPACRCRNPTVSGTECGGSPSAHRWGGAAATASTRVVLNAFVVPGPDVRVHAVVEALLERRTHRLAVHDRPEHPRVAERSRGRLLVRRQGADVHVGPHRHRALGLAEVQLHGRVGDDGQEVGGVLGVRRRPGLDEGVHHGDVARLGAAGRAPRGTSLPSTFPSLISSPKAESFIVSNAQPAVAELLGRGVPGQSPAAAGIDLVQRLAEQRRAPGGPGLRSSRNGPRRSASQPCGPTTDSRMFSNSAGVVNESFAPRQSGTAPESFTFFRSAIHCWTV